MYEHVDFAYFRADATAREAINSGHVGEYAITKDVIVFAGDSGSIYTQGKKFGGSTNITEGTGIDVQEEDGVYTISLDTAWLTQNIKPTSTTIENPYVLPMATSNVLGGIKTGYSTNDRNYGVRVDSNGNAFVNVPWTSSNQDEPQGGGSSSSGTTKEYVDGKISELKQRLDNIVSEINWQNIFNQYGTSGGPNAGRTEDEIKGIIEQWVKSNDGTNIVWQQLTAENANGQPAWVSVVAEKANDWITGSQIQQLEDQISLIVGNFDANGDPIAGKWAGIILTAEDEHGKSVIDLAAEQVISSGQIVTPSLVSTAINAEDITISSKLTATNADINGIVRAKTLYGGHVHVLGGNTLDLSDQHNSDQIAYTYTMEYGSNIILPDPVIFDGLELRFFYPSYKEGERPSFNESPYIYYHDGNNGQIQFVNTNGYREITDKLYIAPGKLVTMQALYGDWYSTNGNVSGQSYN